MSRVVPSLALLLCVLPGCTSAPPAPDPAAQAVVDDLARQNADIVRLTVHGTPPGGGALCAIASTSDDKRGKPSDPEDHEAIQRGQTVVLDEGDALDVTVPILREGGAFKGAAGVTLRAGADRSMAVATAERIARQIEAALKK